MSHEERTDRNERMLILISLRWPPKAEGIFFFWTSPKAWSDNVQNGRRVSLLDFPSGPFYLTIVSKEVCREGTLFLEFPLLNENAIYLQGDHSK